LYKKHYSSAKVSLLHLTKVTQKSLFSFSLSLSLDGSRWSRLSLSGISLRNLSLAGGQSLYFLVFCFVLSHQIWSSLLARCIKGFKNLFGLINSSTDLILPDSKLVGYFPSTHPHWMLFLLGLVKMPQYLEAIIISSLDEAICN
jgi:hypothetical protein